MITIRTTVFTALAVVAIGAAGTGISAAAPTAPAVSQVASPMENHYAESEFATQFAIATGVGGVIGTGIGAGLGCLIVGAPAVAGGPLVLPACVAGAVTGGAIGGIVGTLAAGGPTLIIAGADLASTLAAEPGTTKWAAAK